MFHVAVAYFAGPGAAAEVPAATRVFWSGGNAAKTAATDWAAANGGVTLEMTEAGQAARAATAGMNYLQARPVWEMASQSFAGGASGPVHVFQSAAGVMIDSVWAEFEYRALLGNPNVTSIVYHLVGGH
jgi:hypothetical protein